jgi:hypothetical protein
MALIRPRRGGFIVPVSDTTEMLAALELQELSNEPEIVQKRNAAVERLAREMYNNPVKVDGDRPAFAHRDPAASQSLPAEVLTRWTAL